MNWTKTLAHSAMIALTALLGTACADEGDLPESDLMIEGKTSAFTAWDDARTYLIAQTLGGSTLRVCLTGTGVTTTSRAAYEGHIRNSIMAWVSGASGASNTGLIASSAIAFNCSSPHVTVNWSADAGRANAGRGFINMFNGDGFAVVLHEFGHVFGLGDTYVEGVWNCQPGQQNSVMCGWGGLSSTLQLDDVNGIQEVFCMAFPDRCTRRSAMDLGWCNHSGAQLHLGDFNGDGRDDMLCHDGAGSKWVALANAGGQFTGTSWSSAMGWCNHSGAQLRIGDFNGDGRDDMLCHDGGGSKWVALANAGGQFTGTSWSSAMGWCNHSGSQLHVGDFNGDGRDDMLCHDGGGYKWVALANASGQFPGTSWSSAMGWCNHSGAQLHLGDFNGDGRDDMLCHDGAGSKWVALANASGQFPATSWSSAMGWCNHSGSSLHVGDYNADGRDDMLCHDTAGRKWISFAETGGQFAGTSRYWNMNWCNHSTGQFRIADVDGNSASDFLCHDSSTGFKWVARQFN